MALTSIASPSSRCSRRAVAVVADQAIALQRLCWTEVLLSEQRDSEMCCTVVPLLLGLSVESGLPDVFARVLNAREDGMHLYPLLICCCSACSTGLVASGLQISEPAHACRYQTWWPHAACSCIVAPRLLRAISLPAWWRPHSVIAWRAHWRPRQASGSMKGRQRKQTGWRPLLPH